MEARNVNVQVNVMNVNLDLGLDGLAATMGTAAAMANALPHMAPIQTCVRPQMVTVTTVEEFTATSASTLKALSFARITKSIVTPSWPMDTDQSRQAVFCS